MDGRSFVMDGRSLKVDGRSLEEDGSSCEIEGSLPRLFEIDGSGDTTRGPLTNVGGQVSLRWEVSGDAISVEMAVRLAASFGDCAAGAPPTGKLEP